MLALAAYPSGRLRRWDWWVVVMAVAIAAGVVQQIGVAAAFGVVAARSAVGRLHVDPADRVYPAVSAAAVSMLFAVSWSIGRFSRVAFDPRLVTLGWQALLMMVAAGLIVATRRAQRRRGRLADTVLDGESVAGLEGLGQVLGEVLGDRSLRVLLPPDAAAVTGRGQLFVGDGGRALASAPSRPHVHSCSASSSWKHRPISTAGSSPS